MYNIFILHLINHSRLTIVVTELTKNIIEEGWREKQRQRSSCLFGGQNLSIPCHISCFAPVDLEERVEFIRFF